MMGITTKYLKPTNTRGARIKASIWNWAKQKEESVVIGYPHALSDEVCHFEAVKELIKKYDFEVDMNNMRFGGLRDGYCFCFETSIVRERV